MTDDAFAFQNKTYTELKHQKLTNQLPKIQKQAIMGRIYPWWLQKANKKEENRKNESKQPKVCVQSGKTKS